MSELLVELKEIIRQLDGGRIIYLLNNLHYLEVEELDEIVKYAIDTVKVSQSHYPIKYVLSLLLDSEIPRVQMHVLNYIFVHHEVTYVKVITLDYTPVHEILLDLLTESKVEFQLKFNLIINEYNNLKTYFYFHLFMISDKNISVNPYFIAEHIMSSETTVNNCLGFNENINLQLRFTRWVEEYLTDEIIGVKRNIEIGEYDSSYLPSLERVKLTLKFLEKIRTNAKNHNWIPEYSKMMKTYKKFLTDNKLLMKENVFPLVKK